MTSEEIEKYSEQLRTITAMPDGDDKTNALLELRKQVGAGGFGRDSILAVRDADSIASIHQALQTATMTNMCKTASKNYTIAAWAMIAAVISALAAWVAVLSMN